MLINIIKVVAVLLMIAVLVITLKKKLNVLTTMFWLGIMAMFDDDQKKAVKDLFERLTDLYIRLVDKYIEYFPELDGFYIHDDWGSQRETFFSPELAAEMIVPAMRRLTDHIHSVGRFAELHSCGQAFKQVPNFIAAGWDIWSGQTMNDTQKIYELYGDRLIIGVIPDEFDPASASEDEQRAAARLFVKKFCSDPKKPCIMNAYGNRLVTPAFRETLYEESRRAFAK